MPAYAVGAHHWVRSSPACPGVENSPPSVFRFVFLDPVARWIGPFLAVLVPRSVCVVMTEFEPSPRRVPPRPQARWVFGLYPEAGEGGGSFQSVYRRVPEYVSRGFARDPERAAEEAGRRARATLRRYCAANKLNRLGTLTFAGSGCHDPVKFRLLLADFFRELRSQLGG